MDDDEEARRARVVADRELARIARHSSMARPPVVSINTCDTCRHYQPLPAGHLPNDQVLGGCARWLMGYSVKTTRLPDYGIVVEDEEGWGALMGPKFGCVLWEPKEDVHQPSPASAP